MFDIIRNIISHAWDTNYTGDQTYIYYICSVLIPLSVVLVWDAIFSTFRAFTRFK